MEVVRDNGLPVSIAKLVAHGKSGGPVPLFVSSELNLMLCMGVKRLRWDRNMRRACIAQKTASR
jgi:hypothetical protein